MNEPIWSPDPDGLERTRVAQLMKAVGRPIDPQRTDASIRDFVRWSQQEPQQFWPAVLDDLGVIWSKPYEQVVDLTGGHERADWFVQGETSIGLNCIDVPAVEMPDQLALIAEDESGEVRRWTFLQASVEINRLANLLRQLGIQRGDRVACLMPMVAEVVFAMLATMKVGAIFIPIFSGYAAPAVRERLVDSASRLLFTADFGMRRGKRFPLKDQADLAAADVESLSHMIVLQRGDGSAPMQVGRDLWWQEAVSSCDDDAVTEMMQAMDPALMIYTSGTTGKPKGTIHTHAGCMAQMGKELRYNFDLGASEDLMWWFTDIGWMMGPWEIIGCWLNRVPFVVFEGAPDFPAADRVWSMVERHGVTHLGISPTAIRLLMRSGTEPVDAHPMETLRILGSTGEPWDSDSYRWYFDKVGKGKLPIINISGGTDIVGCFLAPLPVLPLVETSLGSPGLGMDIDVFDEDGNSLEGEVGYLVCKSPAPSMTRSLWNADEKYLETYWSKFPGVWNHGDWALVDEEGQWFLLGRADDTLNIAGRRVGPGEIESALIEHPAVSEAAAIGVPDDLKGTEVVCFAVLHPTAEEGDSLRKELIDQVVEALGKVDRPRAVYFVDDLPKTRSAKIVRRLIRARHLEQEDLGDLSSIANPEALDAIGNCR
ncbi:MAG: AMP-binding protein [Planctomycetota bacterium]|nr:AMP-binding protein [Planctomycetota bacterium]